MALAGRDGDRATAACFPASAQGALTRRRPLLVPLRRSGRSRRGSVDRGRVVSAAISCRANDRDGDLGGTVPATADGPHVEYVPVAATLGGCAFTALSSRCSSRHASARRAPCRRQARQPRTRPDTVDRLVSTPCISDPSGRRRRYVNPLRSTGVEGCALRWIRRPATPAFTRWCWCWYRMRHLLPHSALKAWAVLLAHARQGSAPARPAGP